MEHHTAIVAPHTLGEALRLLQGRSGLNREQVAARVGVSTGALSNYLSDTRAPSASVLRRLTSEFAERMNVDAGQLWVELGDLLAHRYGDQTSSAGWSKRRDRHGG